MSDKKRIMSGMRPTGKLHLGHYMGVLRNWIDFQNEYECFFSIADWHALTTKYDKTEDLKENIVNVALDWIASGINPEQSTVYIQSLVPETAEIHLYLSMITPQNWVERDPTLKDMVKILRKDHEDNEGQQNISGLLNYGLLGYPVLMTADIITFNASLVPVGHDQIAHLELTRDITRRFNYLYKTDYFNEPHPRLTETPLIKGVDGQKMGKSFNNDIKIADSEEVTTKKIMSAVTDRSRLRKTDPGHPEDCEVICPYYSIFADKETQERMKNECVNAIRGCADCKREIATIINNKFRSVREKRAELEQNPDYINKLLIEGSEKARFKASETLKNVKTIMKMYQ
ncbi:MAG: tryptophan--tRNA ligase [bacterium]